MEVEIIAYNETADMCFREYENGNLVIVNGTIKNNDVIIYEIQTLYNG